MYSRSAPSGASPGSVAVGRVTSRDGSLISRPSVMISRNVSCQASPNTIVWWAASGQRRPVPACRTTADGAGRNASARRGVRPSSRYAVGSSVARTTASQGIRSPVSVWTARTRDPDRSSRVTAVP